MLPKSLLLAALATLASANRIIIDDITDAMTLRYRDIDNQLRNINEWPGPENAVALIKGYHSNLLRQDAAATKLIADKYTWDQEAQFSFDQNAYVMDLYNQVMMGSFANETVVAAVKGVKKTAEVKKLIVDGKASYLKLMATANEGIEKGLGQYAEIVSTVNAQYDAAAKLYA